MSDEVAELRAEVELLRRRMTEMEQRHRSEAPPSPDPERQSDRRGFLALAAGTAVAGAAAAVGGATPAAAATGDPLLVGQVTSPSGVGDTTTLESPSLTTLSPVLFWASNYSAPPPIALNATMRVASYGFTGGDDDSDGFRVGMLGAASAMGDTTDNRGVGVYGTTNVGVGPTPEPSEPTGVYGYAVGNLGIGVTGHAVGVATVGVRGVAEGPGIGLMGESSGTGAAGVAGFVDGGGGVAVYAEAPAPSRALVVDGRLHHTVASVPGPPTGVALAGDQWRDSTGAMFLCTASGTPGVWRRVVAQHPDYANAGGSINLLARPIRVVDTRPTSTAPLTNGGNRLAPSTNTSFQITGTTVSGVAVPAGATGVIANITATDTLGNGFFSVFASGLSPTGTSTVNYTDASIANFFMSALSTGGALTVRCGSNAAHCIIDVMGFLY